MRSGYEIRKKTKHKEFISEILQHARDFLDFHKKAGNQRRKKANLVRSHFEKKEKTEIQQEEKNDKEKLKMLRNLQFEEWLKDINLKKQSRLTEILLKTQQYLESLGAKI